MLVAVDFDGTCVRHAYPDIGEDIGATEVLQKMVLNGHKIILWTMRSNSDDGGDLQEAIKWFKNRSIPLYGVNENPGQSSWTNSPKAYAQVYIDDAAIGCPLIYPGNHERPYVDWKKIDEYFEKMNFYYLPHDDIKCGQENIGDI